MLLLTAATLCFARAAAARPEFFVQFVLQISSSNVALNMFWQRFIFRPPFIPHPLSIDVIGHTQACSISSP